MAKIENGYYYIEDDVVLKEDGYTDSVDKIGKVVDFDYETEIRNKAIEEFAEKLDDLILHGVFDSRNHLHECINEIAESMKGGK